MEEWQKDIDEMIVPEKSSEWVLLIDKKRGTILGRTHKSEDWSYDPVKWDADNIGLNDVDRVKEILEKDGFEGLQVVDEAGWKQYYKFSELSGEAKTYVFNDIQKDFDGANAIEGFETKKFTKEELEKVASHGIYLKYGCLIRTVGNAWEGINTNTKKKKSTFE